MIRRGEEQDPAARSNRPPFRLLAWTLALPLAVFLIYLIAERVAAPQAPVTPPPRTSSPVPPSPEPKIAATLPEANKPASRGRIVLILDDFGYDRAAPAIAAELGAPISFAVIPGTPHAVEAANFAASRGFEVLCHLPLEPEGYPGVSPGGNAILLSMSDAEIRERTAEMLRMVPHARGLNNHMGSAATADSRVMGSVLAVARDQGLFFIDSRTTGRSVSEALARKLGIRAASRDVFLDDDRSEAAIRRQIAELCRVADRGEIAIGIGHPHRSTLKVLGEEIPRLRAAGYDFLRASEAVW
ncbi:MAG TPA: divergent polysaccharide deacetylase family protein [Thermoanaerobaculia bacterium]|nr:divergent polysaccharide deacetylase family protein [Thermoanaerobaculia bacterium]